jgi:hypothetical protein
VPQLLPALHTLAYGTCAAMAMLWMDPTESVAQLRRMGQPGPPHGGAATDAPGGGLPDQYSGPWGAAIALALAVHRVPMWLWTLAAVALSHPVVGAAARAWHAPSGTAADASGVDMARQRLLRWAGFAVFLVANSVSAGVAGLCVPFVCYFGAWHSVQTFTHVARLVTQEQLDAQDWGRFFGRRLQRALAWVPGRARLRSASGPSSPRALHTLPSASTTPGAKLTILPLALNTAASNARSGPIVDDDTAVGSPSVAVQVSPVACLAGDQVALSATAPSGAGAALCLDTRSNALRQRVGGSGPPSPTATGAAERKDSVCRVSSLSALSLAICNTGAAAMPEPWEPVSCLSPVQHSSASVCNAASSTTASGDASSGRSLQELRRFFLPYVQAALAQKAKDSTSECADCGEIELPEHKAVAHVKAAAVAPYALALNSDVAARKTAGPLRLWLNTAPLTLLALSLMLPLAFLLPRAAAPSLPPTAGGSALAAADSGSPAPQTPIPPLLLVLLSILTLPHAQVLHASYAAFKATAR